MMKNLFTKMSKKALLGLLCFSGIFHESQAQTTVQIGNGTQVPTNTILSPIYRSSANIGSGGRSNIIYTQSELNTAGIPVGAIINSIAFNKTNTDNFNIPANFSVYMGNTNNTTPLPTTTTWSSLISSHFLVYNNTSYNVPATAGWVSIPLSVPFVYTGGAIEIATDIEMTANSGSTGGFKWQYTNGFADYVVGVTSLSDVLNTTTASNKHRPNIQFTYSVQSNCSGAPVAGTAVSNISTSCPGNQVNLSLSGATTGIGITYQWESSADNITYQNEGTASINPLIIVTPTASRWYRCKVICSGGTPVTSTAVQVIIPSVLNGNYTINSANPTGGNNFASFTDAINRLNCIGISGNVTFNVIAGSGPYTENIVLGDIVGTNANSRIRFNGNGNTVQFSTGSTSRFVLELNGNKYTTIDSLTFKTLGTTQAGGSIISSGAAFDSIINCTFDISSSNNTTAINTVGISFSSSQSAPAGAGEASNIYIGNNTIFGPTGTGGCHYGITLTTGTENVIVENNKISNFNNIGIFTNGGENNIIRGNEISRTTKNTTGLFYGIYTNNNINGIIIDGNKIHSPGGTGNSTNNVYGIYLLGKGSALKPIIVSNNVVYNLNQAGAINNGIHLQSAEYTKVYHNTVVFDKVLSGTAENNGIFTTGANTGTDIVNNLVSITAGSGGVKNGFNYIMVTGGGINDAQRNVFYVNSTQPGTQNYGKVGSTEYSLQSAFQTTHPTLEVGSIVANPQFTNVANGNFLPSNAIFSGAGLNLQSAVPFDFTHYARPVNPTPGAYEIPLSISTDGAMGSLISPTGFYCANTQNIEVSVSNVGANPITNFMVHWELNGVAQAPFTYAGTLGIIGGTGQSVDTITLGQAALSLSTSNQIKAWIIATGDTDPLNDTLTVSLNPTAFSAAILHDSICAGSPVALSLNPNFTGTANYLQWQSSSNGTSFNNISGATSANHTINNVTTNQYYRMFINSGVGGCYSDTITATIVTPTIISSTPGEHCGTGTVNIAAQTSSNTQVYWYNVATGGSSIGMGNNFTSPMIWSTTTYYAEPRIISRETVPSPSYPTTEFYTSATGWGLMFTVNNEVAIDSITVKARHSTTPGVGSIQMVVTDLNDVVVSSGHIHNVNITTTATEYQIPVGIVLAPGNYKMTMIANGVDRFIRNGPGTNAPNYPYNSPSNSISITSGSNGIGASNTTTTEYYWLYNWKLSTGCGGARVPVQATIIDIPVVNLGADTSICNGANYALNAGNTGANYVWDNASTAQTRTINGAGTYYVTVNVGACVGSDTIVVGIKPLPSGDFTTTNGNNGQVSFNATINNASNHVWNFGDGTTGTGANTTHTYDQNGNYTVTLTLVNECDDTVTVTKTVDVTNVVGLRKINDDKLITLYPNPSQGQLYIENKGNRNIESVTIIDAIGRTIKTIAIGSNVHTTSIDVSTFSAGLYSMIIITKEGNIVRKFAVSK